MNGRRMSTTFSQGMFLLIMFLSLRSGGCLCVQSPVISEAPWSSCPDLTQQVLIYCNLEPFDFLLLSIIIINIGEKEAPFIGARMCNSLCEMAFTYKHHKKTILCIFVQ